MTRYVYLAGPMTGIPNDKARDWRQAIIEGFDAFKRDASLRTGDAGVLDVTFLDPLRGLVATHGHDRTIYDKGEFPATAEYGRQRDMMDIRRCDLVIVGGLDTGNRVSIGTMMEMGMCMAWGKPMILQAVGLTHTLHGHPWVMQGTQFRTHNPEDTVKLLHYLMMERNSSPDPEREPDYAYSRAPNSDSGAGTVVPLGRTPEAQPDPIRPASVAGRLDTDRGVRQADPAILPQPHRTICD